MDEAIHEREQELLREYNKTREQFGEEQAQEILKQREQLLAYAQEHKGHEEQHAWILLITLVCLVGFQILFIFWRRRHPQSFDLVTLLGLWGIPPFMFLLGHGVVYYKRFFVLWALYSAGNWWVIRLANAKPLHHQTPRIVYSWFYRMYQLFYGVGVFGYAMILLELFGLTSIFFGPRDPMARTWFEVGFYFLVYGIYFGLMSRDLAKILADRMASTIGYYTKDGLPSKHLRDSICAICGESLDSALTKTEDGGGVHQLACRHMFHEGCIRGWCLIGKKDLCPYCKEKVDLKQFAAGNPWDTQTLLYLQLLDAVRYLVVWQPLVLGFAQLVSWSLGLH